MAPGPEILSSCVTPAFAKNVFRTTPSEFYTAESTINTLWTSKLLITSNTPSHPTNAYVKPTAGSFQTSGALVTSYLATAFAFKASKSLNCRSPIDRETASPPGKIRYGPLITIEVGVFVINGCTKPPTALTYGSATSAL